MSEETEKMIAEISELDFVKEISDKEIRNQIIDEIGEMKIRAREMQRMKANALYYKGGLWLTQKEVETIQPILDKAQKLDDLIKKLEEEKKEGKGWNMSGDYFDGRNDLCNEILTHLKGDK